MIFNNADADLEKAAKILAASDGDWQMVYERFPKYAPAIQAFREDSSKRRKGEIAGPRSMDAILGNQILSSISVRAKKYATIYKNGNNGGGMKQAGAIRKRRRMVPPDAPAVPQMPLFEISTSSSDLVEQLSDRIANQIVEKALEKALKKLAGVI